MELKGVDGVYLNLKRQHDGLHVHVRVHQDIEEFFKTASGGEHFAVYEGGREWVSEEALRVYSIRNGLTSPSYDLTRVGRNIIAQDPDSGNLKPNLSFLRIVGVSREEGVKFRIAGVYSKDQLVSIGDGTRRAFRQFYSDFMRPVEVVVRLVQVEG